MSWSGRRRAARRQEIDEAMAVASGDQEMMTRLLIEAAGEAGVLLELDKEQSIRWEWYLAGTDGLIGEA